MPIDPRRTSMRPPTAPPRHPRPVEPDSDAAESPADRPSLPVGQGEPAGPAAPDDRAD